MYFFEGMLTACIVLNHRTIEDIQDIIFILRFALCCKILSSENRKMSLGPDAQPDTMEAEWIQSQIHAILLSLSLMNDMDNWTIMSPCGTLFTESSESCEIYTHACWSINL